MSHKYSVGQKCIYKEAKGINRLTSINFGDELIITKQTGVSNAGSGATLGLNKYTVKLVKNLMEREDIYESELHYEPLIKRNIPWL